MSAPNKKTAKQIADLFITTFEAQLSQNIPLFPRALNRLIAKVLGIAFVVIFQYSEFVALQMFVKTASDRPITIGGITYTPLDMWGNLIGYTRNTGLRSEGTVTVNVNTTSGSLFAGAQILDSDTQQLYLVITDTSLVAPTTTVYVRAVEYSTAATLYAGQRLSFVSAPSNIEKNCVVATVTQQGADPEDTESWRNRQLGWWAARPQGGAYADYREWGLEVDGVENIYPFSGGTDAIPTSGPGQADIYVEASETTDGIAPAALLTAVYDNIELTAASGLANRRNMNTYVNTASIYRRTFDPVISGLNVSDPTTAMAAIEDALETHMLDRENYIVGLSRLPRRDVISDAEVGGIVGRVVASYGGTVGAVSVVPGGVPAYILTEGEKAKLGTISWI